MDNKKLKVKDLVNIGVFGVIYLVLLFVIKISEDLQDLRLSEKIILRKISKKE